MNLREDINRIKEVMGINESRDMFFKRRLNEFLDIILTSYEWMDEFIDDVDSFEDYLKLILRHSIDAFFEFNDILVRGDEIEELLPLALLSLRNDERLFRKIKENYYSKKSPARMNESNEIALIKRRMDVFLDHLKSSYDWQSPRRFKDFDDFLERVVFAAARDFIHDEIGGEYDEQLRIRAKLEPILLNLVKKLPIYDDIYQHYITFI